MTERKTHNYLAGHENSWREKGKKKGKMFSNPPPPPKHTQIGI